jgi:hypothetical protein
MPLRWVHPSLSRTYSIKGGYLNKPLPVETLVLSELTGQGVDIVPPIDKDADPLADVFVKLDKSAEWLIKAVGGANAQRGFLRRTMLIEDLKAKMVGCVDSIAVADDDDPMGELCEVDTPTKKKKYTCKRKWKFVAVDMPQCEPTRHPDSTERRVVRLLGLSTNQVWLPLPDVPWLLTWLADAVSTGGVPTPPASQLLANSPAVAGVNFKWDFVSEDSWEAVIITGPDKGTKITASVSAFNEDKWNEVDAIHQYGVSFAESTYEQRKAATLHFLEAHCKRRTNARASTEPATP